MSSCPSKLQRAHFLPLKGSWWACKEGPLLGKTGGSHVPVLPPVAMAVSLGAGGMEKRGEGEEASSTEASMSHTEPVSCGCRLPLPSLHGFLNLKMSVKYGLNPPPSSGLPALPPPPLHHVPPLLHSLPPTPAPHCRKRTLTPSSLRARLLFLGFSRCQFGGGRSGWVTF